MQVSQKTGSVVWWSRLRKQLSSLLWSTHKLQCGRRCSRRCFPGNPLLLPWSNVGNLISGSSAFSKSSFNISKFLVHVLLTPSLKDSEHYLASMWNEDSCEAVWTFFGIDLLRDWKKNSPFPVLWPLLNFPNLLAYWVQRFNSIIFQDSKQLSSNSMTSTSFVHRSASWSPL